MFQANECHDFADNVCGVHDNLKACPQHNIQELAVGGSLAPLLLHKPSERDRSEEICGTQTSSKRELSFDLENGCQTISKRQRFHGRLPSGKCFFYRLISLS